MNIATDPKILISLIREMGIRKIITASIEAYRRRHMENTK
jgi:hypothetical protein